VWSCPWWCFTRCWGTRLPGDGHRASARRYRVQDRRHPPDAVARPGGRDNRGNRGDHRQPLVEYGDELPGWDESVGGYLDPATGEVLPDWDQALDELGDQPHHVASFGVRFDAQRVLAGSKDAARCIGLAQVVR
jgi:hypothetical protein